MRATARSRPCSLRSGLTGSWISGPGQRVLIERYEQLFGESVRSGITLAGQADNLSAECELMASLSRDEASALERSDPTALAREVKHHC